MRIHLLDRSTLGHKAQLDTKRIAPDFIHAEGSVVLPNGWLAAINFDGLYLTHLEP